MPKLAVPVLLLAVSFGLAVVYSQDPCVTARNLYDPSQNRSSNYRAGAGVPLICDDGISRDEWVRFDRPGTDSLESSIPTKCVAYGQCGTGTPMWMDGVHPSKSAPGPVDAKVCGVVSTDCCAVDDVMKVKWCSPGYYVYKIPPASFCDSAYCFDEVIIDPPYPRFYPDTLTLQDPFISDQVPTFTYIDGQAVKVNATVFSIGCSVKFNSVQIQDEANNGPFNVEINLVVQNGSAVIPLLPKPFIHDSTAEHTYLVGEQYVKGYLGKPIMCSAVSYWQRTPGVKSPVQYSRAIQLELKITTNLPQLLQSTETPVTIQEGGSVKVWIESNFPLSTRHCFLQPSKPCQPYAFSVNMTAVDLRTSGCTLDATPVQFATREFSSLTVAPVQTIGRRAAPFTVPVNFNDLDQKTFQESILSGHKPKAVPITIVDSQMKPVCISIYDPHITQFGNTTYHILQCCGCYTLLKSKCPGPTCRDFEIQVINHPWSQQLLNAANCAIAIREGTYLITIDACKQSEPPYYRMTQERLGGVDDGTLPKPTLVTIDPMQWKITLLSGIEVVVQLYKTPDLLYGNLQLYVTGLAGDEYEGLCSKDTNENNYHNSRLATCSSSLFYNKTACYKQATAQRTCACPVGAATDVCPATDDGSTGLPTFTSQGAGVCNDGQTTTRPQVTAMSAITINGQTFLIPSGDLLSQKSFEEFDVVLNDGSNHQWPTPNKGITEADARNACQKALQDQAVYSQCVQFVNIQPIIESCMLDIQLTESVSFVPSYGEQFTSLCRHEVAAGIVSNGTAAEDAERVALLQNIESKICPRQCMYNNVVRGTCQNGACLCYDGYAGSDCSIATSEPPSSVKAITEFIDHKGFSSNHTFIVVLSASNINTVGRLDCRIERVKGEKLPPVHSVPPAGPISGGMVACIIQTDEKLTDALYRMKISVSNGVAEPVRRKRRSNDRTTYSDPVVVTLYDGNCVSCSKGRDCASLDGWCIRKEVCTKIDDSTKGNCKQLVPTTTRSPHSKPTTPSAPSKPTTRSAPSKPTTRSAPSKPTTRSAPSKPTTPSAPSKPTTRSVPSKPTTRSAPSKPTTRSTPSKPTTRPIAYG